VTGPSTKQLEKNTPRDAGALYPCGEETWLQPNQRSKGTDLPRPYHTEEPQVVQAGPTTSGWTNEWTSGELNYY
jgi:hypothetical protein